MNDFTKEELETIFLNLCVNDKTKEIIQKLSHMIYNYCEIKPPKIDKYVCGICNEEWYRCECKQ